MRRQRMGATANLDRTALSGMTLQNDRECDRFTGVPASKQESERSRKFVRVHIVLLETRRNVSVLS